MPNLRVFTREASQNGFLRRPDVLVRKRFPHAESITATQQLATEIVALLPDLGYKGTAVVALTRSSTKLVLQSSTLGCLSKVSMMKRL